MRLLLQIDVSTDKSIEHIFQNCSKIDFEMSADSCSSQIALYVSSDLFAVCYKLYDAFVFYKGFTEMQPTTINSPVF